MRVPNKLYTYEESALSKFPYILNLIGSDSIDVKDLLKHMKDDRIITDVSELIEILECLYYMNRISYTIYNGRMIIYAEDFAK